MYSYYLNQLIELERFQKMFILRIKDLSMTNLVWMKIASIKILKLHN